MAITGFFCKNALRLQGSSEGLPVRYEQHSRTGKEVIF